MSLIIRLCEYPIYYEKITLLQAMWPSGQGTEFQD